MRFSESWLRSLISPEPELTSSQLADRLTMLGLEVDAVEPAGSVDNRVVVAEVVSVAGKVCVVSAGAKKSEITVVCGAPNVAVGMKTALAQVGAEIPGGRIEAREVQGVVSQGMLVSESEIGLGDRAHEIIELDRTTPVGAPLHTVYALDDRCISLDLTPDRGDCLGVVGIARDLAAAIGGELQLPVVETPERSIDDRMPIRLQAGEACARFLSAVCRDLNPRARSPLMLRERLRRSGLRSIHPAVDITNYVMLEFGRPLHAFDFAKIEQRLIVRYGRDGERLVLLDGKEVTLDSGILAVCDSKRPLSLAGIMGDAVSGVTDATRDVVFECAWFNPLMLGRTARRLGIQTDSSMRFERGVDPGMIVLGMNRARSLLAEISGARLGPVVTAESAEHLPRRETHRLRASQVTRLTGQEVAPDFIEQGLSRLGFAPDRLDEASWNVEVPSHRFDIEGEADLVEEVARLHGFDDIPEIACEGLGSPSRVFRMPRQLREYVAALGYHEIISYSFLPAELALMVGARSEHVSLLNPMSSDQAVMRRSLMPGLLRVLAANLSRQHLRARLFELGRVFLAKDAELDTQPLRLAALHCGDQWPESWSQDKRDADFFDLKGDVERLLEYCGWWRDIEWQPSTDALCHPVRGARLLLDGRYAGMVAELHPDHRRQLDIDKPVCFFELDVDVLVRRQPATFEEPSKFPQVRRDVAVLVRRDLPVSNLLSAVREAGDELLREADVFDVYQGSGIENNDKSVAIRLVFQTSERTLRDEEITMRVDWILESLRRQCNARLRGV